MGDFMPPSASSKKVLGFDLGTGAAPFIVCSGGIFLCYCLSSLAQEYLYQSTEADGEKFSYTSTVTLWSKLGAVLWGVASGGTRETKAPQLWHFGIGMLSFATMYLSNESLMWLNYPTQTLFKSAKLLPVMAASVVINRTRFLALEYFSAVGLLLGLVAFTLTDISVSPEFHPLGVLLICLALCADALIGNLQERMFKQFGCDASEMLTFSSAWAALFSLATCVVAGETISGTVYLLAHPVAAASVAAYSLLNILGIFFVLAMIAHYGATLTTFTTSLRKALSLTLSFLVYPKPFAFGYLVGFGATAAGIAMNMKASQMKKAEKERAAIRAAAMGAGADMEDEEQQKSPRYIPKSVSSMEMGRLSSASGVHSPGLPTTPFDTSMLLSDGSGRAPPRIGSTPPAGPGTGSGAASFAFAPTRSSRPDAAVDVELGSNVVASGAVRSDSDDDADDADEGALSMSPTSRISRQAEEARLRELRVDRVLQALNANDDANDDADKPAPAPTPTPRAKAAAALLQPSTSRQSSSEMP